MWGVGGYHIFIFTGHIGSYEDGTIGWIGINNQERLTIEEFKDSFKQAINQGLQLAIFNSCDGLGLADRLSELNLAQIIVMSEPVPDEIAIEFLSNFFQEFISDNSLFSSVHKARKKLAHFNARYPGAFWLPSLCLKPAQSYFCWSDIQPRNKYIKAVADQNNNLEDSKSSLFKNILQILLISITAIATFIAGLCLNLIFPQVDTNFITQPVVNIVDSYFDSQPKLDLPLGTWQYSGSSTWRSISDLINQQIQQKYPYFKLIYTYHPTLPIASGTGIKMLLNGQISFALSSRPVENDEYDSAIIRGKILKQVPIAIDGVAVVVNPKLNIDGLTIKQLEAIYRGKITNWGEIGGQDLPIVPYARPLQSGTTEFVRNNILKDRTYVKNIVFVEDSNYAIKQVESLQDLGGIYFVSASEIINNPNLKILSLARRSSSTFIGLNYTANNRLNIEALQTGEYPLVRRLFIIIEINSPIDEEVGEAYKNFLLSKQGQELISKAGFIPIRYYNS
ncbi:MAG: substrate-binding domain-containing protein [Pleurocapsa sp.]